MYRDQRNYENLNRAKFIGAGAFVKAVNSAQLSGKDYNDAVSKWLKANQQKFGYKYSYQKAK